jgi:hypothetical protein
MMTHGRHCELRIDVALVPGDMLMNQHIPIFRKAQVSRVQFTSFPETGHSLHQCDLDKYFIFLYKLQVSAPSPFVDSKPP